MILPLTTDDDVTQLLGRLRRSPDEADPGAAEELLLRLYDALRSIARETMGRERPNHTLQPTALVHEAWLRHFAVDGRTPIEFTDRDHVIRVMARTMRRILVDHARKKHASKRGGHARAVELDSLVADYERQGTDLVEFDDALSALAETDEELARVVELKVFGGLEMGDIAGALDVSLATAERRWRVAKMWMARVLSK